MNHQLFQFLRQRFIVLPALFLLCVALCAYSCGTPGASLNPGNPINPVKGITLQIYFDPTIFWSDDTSKRKLIEALLEVLRANPLIIRARVVELGTTRKARETFSQDFDLGPPVVCRPADIPRELRGNVQAEKQATDDAAANCRKELDARRARLTTPLNELAAWLARPAHDLTRCTSFTDFIARLRQDEPDYALVITDARANCREPLETFTPTRDSRLIVIQCPDPEGRTTERSELLKKMLPTAQIFPMHQVAEAMQSLNCSGGQVQASALK